jgi:hypothetical protein
MNSTTAMIQSQCSEAQPAENERQQENPLNETHGVLHGQK